MGLVCVHVCACVLGGLDKKGRGNKREINDEEEFGETWNQIYFDSVRAHSCNVINHFLREEFTS